MGHDLFGKLVSNFPDHALNDEALTMTLPDDAFWRGVGVCLIATED